MTLILLFSSHKNKQQLQNAAIWVLSYQDDDDDDDDDDEDDHLKSIVNVLPSSVFWVIISHDHDHDDKQHKQIKIYKHYDFNHQNNRLTIQQSCWPQLDCAAACRGSIKSICFMACWG